MNKVIKWSLSFLRILKYKIKYGKRFKVEFALKPVFIGKNCKIKIKDGYIELKSGVYLDDFCELSCIGGKIFINQDVYINTFSRIVSMKNICIGKKTMLGSNVSIYDHDHDISNGLDKYQKKYLIKDVDIGSNVWCCTGTVITKGTIIENNCVLGANAVACGKLSANGLYVGIPAGFKKRI